MIKTTMLTIKKTFGGQHIQIDRLWNLINETDDVIFKPFMQYLYILSTNNPYDSIKELNTFKTLTWSANNFLYWNGVLVAQ